MRRQRWVIRRRLWRGELLWLAYHQVDPLEWPDLWRIEAISTSWREVLAYAVREAWHEGDVRTPVEPPASAR